jgi:F-type H+-transporting ATPase subunit b
MRHILPCWSLPLVLLSAAIAFSLAPARVLALPEDEHGDHPANKDAKGVKYTYHAHHKAETLDTSNDEQVKKFVDSLKKGEIEGNIEEKKEVNILALKWDLGLWAMVVFLLLLLVLGRYAWKPMLEGLQKREETIRGSVEEAKRTRDEMEQMRTKFKTEMDQAYAKIPQLMDDARRDAQKMAEEMRAKAVADIQAERQRLRHELEVARDQALSELWTQAAQLATLISAKAIGRSLTEDDHSRLLDEALEEMRHVKT